MFNVVVRNSPSSLPSGLQFSFYQVEESHVKFNKGDYIRATVIKGPHHKPAPC